VVLDAQLELKRTIETVPKAAGGDRFTKTKSSAVELLVSGRKALYDDL
jgi:hypothetical protein